jgi:hypothetical protein
LHEKHPNHPKTAQAKIKFARYWLSLTPEQLKAVYKDEKSLSSAQNSFASLGLKDEATYENLVEENLK